MGAGRVARRGDATTAAALAVGVTAVSSAAILVRVADAPALSVSWWRTLGGALALAPFAWRRHRAGAVLDRTRSLQVVASGAFLAAHFAVWIASLSYTTVASSVTLVTMSPVFVALGGARFLGERAPRRVWIGMAVAIAGAVVIGIADLGAADLGTEALLGDLLAVTGSLTITGYLLLGRSVRRAGVPTTVYAAWTYGIAATLLLVVCTVTGTALGGYPAPTWLALAGLVAGPQLLGHTVFNAVLGRVTATVVAIVVLAEPVGATALAWAFLGELPAPGFWAGAPLILGGVAVATRRPSVPEPVIQRPEGP